MVPASAQPPRDNRQSGGRHARRGERRSARQQTRHPNEPAPSLKRPAPDVISAQTVEFQGLPPGKIGIVRPRIGRCSIMYLDSWVDPEQADQVPVTTAGAPLQTPQQPQQELKF